MFLFSFFLSFFGGGGGVHTHRPSSKPSDSSGSIAQNRPWQTSYCSKISHLAQSSLLLFFHNPLRAALSSSHYEPHVPSTLTVASPIVSVVSIRYQILKTLYHENINILFYMLMFQLYQAKSNTLKFNQFLFTILMCLPETFTITYVTAQHYRAVLLALFPLVYTQGFETTESIAL